MLFFGRRNVSLERSKDGSACSTSSHPTLSHLALVRASIPRIDCTVLNSYRTSSASMGVLLFRGAWPGGWARVHHSDRSSNTQLKGSRGPVFVPHDTTYLAGATGSGPGDEGAQILPEGLVAHVDVGPANPPRHEDCVDVRDEPQQVIVGVNLAEDATQGSYALLASSGVGERAAVVLEISGSPMQLEAIVDAIGSDRAERSIRNALADDDRFTRVDRTSWALASWGLESYQSIRTLIANELDRNDGSVRLSRLVTTLTERFTISSSSIITYAGGLPFVTVDGMVEYATSSIVVPRRSPAETRRLFRVQDMWLLRLQLSIDHARGSGSVLPTSLIPILGISYGESVSRPCRLGDQRFAWNGSQLTIGSIKRFVDQDGLVVGDTCFAVFGDSGGFDLIKVIVPSEPGRLRASALAGLTIVGSEDLADLARSVGRLETSSPSQVAEALRARGDYDLADSIAAADW